MAKYIFLASFILVCAFLNAQKWHIKSYTTANGLSSNNVYKCVQDKRGFIWMCTDNGVVRFDGHNFKQYTIADGLPDNDVPDICIDSNQVIWVLPFKRKPAYYSPATNHFVNEQNDSLLKKLDFGSSARMNVLTYGGVAFNTVERPTQIIKGGSLFVLEQTHFSNHLFTLSTINITNNTYLSYSGDSLRFFVNNKEQRCVHHFIPGLLYSVILGRSYYYNNAKGLWKCTFNENGEIIKLISKPLFFDSEIISYTGKHIALAGRNGGPTYLIDTATLEIVETLPTNGALARNVIEDNIGNIWITTNGQGLLKLTSQRVKNLNHFTPIHSFINAIAFDRNKLIIANKVNDLYVLTNNRLRQVNLKSIETIYNVPTIRKILPFKNGCFIVSDGMQSIVVDTGFTHPKNYWEWFFNRSSKAGKWENDSTLLAGSEKMAIRYNFNSAAGIDTIYKRCTAIDIDFKGRLLCGSTDGLYRKDWDSLYYFGNRYPILKGRISSICNTRDGLVWVGLGSNSLVVLSADTLLAIIDIGFGMTGNTCNTIYSNKPGQVWIGTNFGLNRINYTVTGKKLKTEISNFTTTDGLTGEEVNDICISHDSVYIATNNGINYLSTNETFIATEIPTYITDVITNEVNTTIAPALSLKYTQNDIAIHFSCVDLSGHIPVCQYKINNGEWQALPHEELLLKRLAPGDYNIAIRALKRDGNPSAMQAAINIHINAPFWQTWWFWLITGIILLSFLFYIISYNENKKRAKQLENIKAENELAVSQQQTFSALMNPHFIFNALNSIQHYILLQDKTNTNRYLSSFGRLMRMNFEAAQKSFITLDEELERIHLYLSLEKMRFGEKLAYKIEIDDSVQPEDWDIPAMMIQPFLENAIIHGIAPINITGIITIYIRISEEKLLIMLTDNGIGINNSLRLKESDTHKSKAMLLIKNRIDVMKKLYGQGILLSITPAYPANNIHPGTTVSLLFPKHIID